MECAVYEREGPPKRNSVKKKGGSEKVSGHDSLVETSPVSLDPRSEVRSSSFHSLQK